MGIADHRKNVGTAESAADSTAKYVITLSQYFMGREATHSDELTPLLLENAQETVRRFNELAAIYEDMTGQNAPDQVTSGWRPKSINDRVPGAAKGSKHLTCEAIDVRDDGPFDKWCMTHPAHLAEAGLWQEHPGWTDGWCHLQTVPPRSSPQVRVFIPNWNDPMTTIYGTSPVIWTA